MKKVVGGYVLPSYPHLSEEVMINKYYSKTQLRGVIIQTGNTIAYYSHKSSPAQIKYTDT